MQRFLIISLLHLTLGKRTNTARIKRRRNVQPNYDIMNARMVDALGMRIAYHIQTFTVYVRQCDGVETTTEVAASAQSRKMKIVSTTKRKKNAKETKEK